LLAKVGAPSDVEKANDKVEEHFRDFRKLVEDQLERINEALRPLAELSGVKERRARVDAVRAILQDARNKIEDHDFPRSYESDLDEGALDELRAEMREAYLDELRKGDTVTMGLDITAYQTVKLEIPCTLQQLASMRDRDRDDEVFLFNELVFEARCDGLAHGFYTVSGGRRDFRVGSYGSYNDFRRGLAALVGETPERIWGDPDFKGPFAELINFSDCEGFIGPWTSDKLAKDFEAYRFKAGGGDFGRLYAEWLAAFKLASQTGAVKFH
jgi:hypothetical protein